MKNTILALASLVFLSAAAAVPLKWTVEVSRLQPVQFDAVRGETLALEAAFNAYGKPLEIAGPAALYYQTNGMGAAWWSVPAEVSSNRVSALFTPDHDPGASRLACFLGGTASTYRASFALKFASVSPGAAPNRIPLPTVEYSLSSNDVAALLADAVPSLTNTVPSAVSNVVTKTYVEGLGISGGSDGGAPNYAAVSNAAMNALSVTGGDVSGLVSFNDGLRATKKSYFLGGCYINSLSVANWSALIDFYNDQSLADYLASGDWNTADDPFVTESGLPSTPEAVGAAPASITNVVNAWQTYWDGDDVRLTVTNYYGALDKPRLYLEQKTADGGTNYFRTVWDEQTRLDPIWSQVNSNKTELAEKADRAWGFYDSHTGEYSPDNFTQISSSNVLIAAGMSYQKTLTAGGCAVWVLKATEPTTVSGTTTNGFFRIEDADGNALFEIVKGDKRTVGATAASLSMGASSVMTITYNVVSSAHPTISVSASLENPAWLAEGSCSSLASVSWSGSSGAWIATVTPVAGTTRLFVKASYETGGETYVKNTAPLGFDRVYVGGAYYRVSVETVNGKKLMVLTDE